MSTEAIAIFEAHFRRRPSADERAELEAWPAIDADLLADLFAYSAQAGRCFTWSVAAMLVRRGLLPVPAPAEVRS